MQCCGEKNRGAVSFPPFSSKRNKREISVKFEQVFKLFAACHFVYDSTDYLNDGKIDKLGN